MSRPLPAGAALLDDANARASFDAFARRDGVARDEDADENARDVDLDASSSRPKFAALNVGATLMTPGAASDGADDRLRAFVLGAGGERARGRERRRRRRVRRAVGRRRARRR